VDLEPVYKLLLTYRNHREGRRGRYSLALCCSLSSSYLSHRLHLSVDGSRPVKFRCVSTVAFMLLELVRHEEFSSGRRHALWRLRVIKG